MSIYFERRGSGDPVLLLHGTGSQLRAWDRIVPLLAPHAETVAFDLPGFGRSAPPARPPRTVGDLVETVEAFIDAHELGRPHVVGNSGGGWLALELAKRGRARSVVALGPLGLWRTRTGRSPLFVQANFHLSYRAAGALRRWHEPILRSRAGRAALMSQVMGRPWRMTYEEARENVTAFLDAPTIMDMAGAIARGRFTGGQRIDVPVTVAYGTRDVALLPHHRRRDELPPHTRWITLPGCGHVPMADDPERVARVVLDGTVGAASGRDADRALTAA